MRRSLLLIFISFYIGCTSDKIVPATPSKITFPIVGHLPEQLKELSGILSFGDGIIMGHNDSGHPASLYAFNYENRFVHQVYDIEANHVDWEDITADESNIYIGDIGNNNGTRTDLVIYKINKNDLVNYNAVPTKEIHFHFPEQVDYSSRSNHNFDCEAIISVNDSLYLFSKNRENLQTDLYQIPKSPGDYPAKKIGTFDVEGLITGATLNLFDRPILALLGYEIVEMTYHPFVYLFYDFEGLYFFSGQHQKILLPWRAKSEAICFINEEEILIASEGNTEPVHKMDIKDWIQ